MTNTDIRKKEIMVLLSICLLFISSVVYSLQSAPATFSDTIPQYYRWISPESVNIPSSANLSLWIDAPSGFKVQAVNESTGVYAGVVTYGSRTIQRFPFTSGNWTFLVDSADRSGTFTCGIY